MEPTGFTHDIQWDAHSSSPVGFATEGGVRERDHHRWGRAKIHGHTFNDFAGPARLLESLLIAAAGVAEQLDARDRDDAHLSTAALYSHRIALAISRLAETGHGDCTDHDPCGACRSLAGKEPCERCNGDGMTVAGHLPSGDADMDVCDDCGGAGSVVLTGGGV